MSVPYERPLVQFDREQKTSLVAPPGWRPVKQRRPGLFVLRPSRGVWRPLVAENKTPDFLGWRNDVQSPEFGTRFLAEASWPRYPTQRRWLGKLHL